MAERDDPASSLLPRAGQVGASQADQGAPTRTSADFLCRRGCEAWAGDGHPGWRWSTRLGREGSHFPSHPRARWEPSAALMLKPPSRGSPPALRIPSPDCPRLHPPSPAGPRPGPAPFSAHLVRLCKALCGGCTFHTEGAPQASLHLEQLRALGNLL